MKKAVRAAAAGNLVTHPSSIAMPISKNVPKCPKMSRLGELSQLGGLVETNRTIFHKPSTPWPCPVAQNDIQLRTGANNFDQSRALRHAKVTFQSPITTERAEISCAKARESGSSSILGHLRIKDLTPRMLPAIIPLRWSPTSVGLGCGALTAATAMLAGKSDRLLQYSQQPTATSFRRDVMRRRMVLRRVMFSPAYADRKRPGRVAHAVDRVG